VNKLLSWCLAIGSLLLATVVTAVEISIGETAIQIPNPPEFVAVTPEMSALVEFQKNFVAPMNVEYQVFISKDAASVALKNQIPDLDKRFAVQTQKALVKSFFTKKEFSRFKEGVKQQNEKIMENAKAKIDQMMDKISNDVSKQYDMDLALTVSQVVPQPVFMETDQLLAYTAYVKYEMTDEKGNPETFVTTVTAVFVYIKGKVLFLYTYAGENDLEWSQVNSTTWANAVVQANPPDVGSISRETIKELFRKFVWD